MIKTIIFDWDGTLHDTLQLYAAAFRNAYDYLCEQGYAGKREFSDSEISPFLGMNAIDMWNTFMPELPPEVKATVSSMIGVEMVEQIKAHKAKLYPNALKVLRELKKAGYRLVFLSNCKRAYMEAHTEEFGLKEYFDDFFCCEDYGFIPKEDIFPDIKSSFQGEYLVVGDRKHDLAVAKVHGLKSVGCLYGFGTDEELETADYKIKDISFLLDIAPLNNYNPSQSCEDA